MQYLIALKELFTGFLEIMNLVKQAYALYQQAKLEGWLDEGKALAAKIKGAQTDEERRKLVRDLVGHTGDMP